MGKSYMPGEVCDTRDLQMGYVMDHQGVLALQLIEAWGMVAGKDEGEDSAGRAKLALMPPGEVVERAFETAELAYLELEKRGWIEPFTATAEAVHERIGELRGIMSDAEYAPKERRAQLLAKRIREESMAGAAAKQSTTGE